jgi:hypothetical protein
LQGGRRDWACEPPGYEPEEQPDCPTRVTVKTAGEVREVHEEAEEVLSGTDQARVPLVPEPVSYPFARGGLILWGVFVEHSLPAGRRTTVAERTQNTSPGKATRKRAAIATRKIAPDRTNQGRRHQA